MSLAAKLPWNHRFAGGYPGLSSQPLPTDADAIDYLTRVATADGAGVETSVAVAVDAFFRYTKAAGVFDALKACCILAGARTITGALVPLSGTAPTAQGGWAAGDYSRTAGLTGDGNALYLDLNQSPADITNNTDIHSAVYATTGLTGGRHFGVITSGAVGPVELYYGGTAQILSRICNTVGTPIGSASQTGFIGQTRSSTTSYDVRIGGSNSTVTQTVNGIANIDMAVFATNNAGSITSYGDSTLVFYSIGTDIGSAGLAALDTAVTNLITAIGNAL